MNFPASVDSALKSHGYKMVFATVCGAHLAGLSAADSVYEIRGAHILPANHMLGLIINDELIELRPEGDGSPIEFATQDIKKFFALMLKDNGYVLEQVYSPLVVQTSPEHDELKEIGKSCVTRLHCYHYLGYADSQWQQAIQDNNEKEELPTVSRLLTIYRLLLTGTHLMQSGEIETNLSTLNRKFTLSYVDELLERISQQNDQTLAPSEWQFHQNEYERLREMLEDSSDATKLPETSTAHSALDDLLKRIRLADLELALAVR